MLFGCREDCNVIVCYGGAKLADKRLAATVHRLTTRLLDGSGAVSND
jgi:hypothetical protein